MASESVRNILLRALFEPDFHQRLLTDPDAALRDYALTDAEIAVIKKPTVELYQHLAAGPSPARSFLVSQGQPTVTTTTTTTVAVIVVVAITVFVTAIAASTQQSLEIERYRPLLDAIKSSSGQVRIDLVKTLINELTREG